MHVEPERIHHRNDLAPRRGDYVLYWMQASVRAEHNPALEHAIATANELERPLLVCFGLMDDYPEASERHYRFLLEGLAAAATGLARRNVKLVVRRGHPVDVALALAADACAVVMERGYLRHLRAWRDRVAAELDLPVVEVEGDVVVPVETVSDKREYAARTIRPKLHRTWDRFLRPVNTVTLDRHSLGLGIDGIEVADVDAVLASLDIDRSVPPVPQHFTGGTFRARARLRSFLEDTLPVYDEHRNQPHTDHVSHLSMYLHYGHISPVYVALAALESGAPEHQVDGFVEELIVRRELAFNYVWFEPGYDRYSALPDWARRTLAEHRDDPREYVYTRHRLARGETHDPYWNAAMAEMRETGYLHNHMRMYWGKKILEWTTTPEHGFRTVLALNNRYLLDGRDPSSYANVGWVFGLHDRPWQERPVFGTVRSMTASGLERKTDPAAYVAKVEERIGHPIE
jgi:deoxyribodipyrimidine photo-lyase